jgi:hypothetical protein
MRGLIIVLGVLAGLALPGTARPAVGANTQVARSDAEARRLCGARPTIDPGWRCVGRPTPDRKPAGHMGGLRVKYTYRQITWSWVKRGKSATDDWTAP